MHIQFLHIPQNFEFHQFGGIPQNFAWGAMLPL